MSKGTFKTKFEKLSPQQKEVLQRFWAGETDEQIARALQTKEVNVRKVIENICGKFGIEKALLGERRNKRPELIRLCAIDGADILNSRTEVEVKQVIAQAEEAVQTLAILDLNTNQEDMALRLKALSTIYHRDVFILIDRSGSMSKKDADTGLQSRYDYLREVVEGDVAAILAVGNAIESNNDVNQRICGRVSINFYSRNQVASNSTVVDDASQVADLFNQHKPRNHAYIEPTLGKCLDIWLAESRVKGRGAFFIIYTDGDFDDKPAFVDCLKKACAKIQDHREVKFILLGIGNDIDKDYFLELDFDINNQMAHDVFVFDLVNEVEDITEVLERQLVNNPLLAFPEWVKKDHLEFVQKVINLRSLT